MAAEESAAAPARREYETTSDGALEFTSSLREGSSC
jgi:hypothetical protein